MHNEIDCSIVIRIFLLTALLGSINLCIFNVQCSEYV